MNDDTGTSIQNQNLIGDDVANEINTAMGDQMSGSVTPPTVVQPTHSTGSLINDSPASDDSGTVATPDEPAVDPAPSASPDNSEPAETPDAEPAANSSLPPDEPADDAPAVAASVSDDDRGSGNFSELQDIKQEALTKLAPLVEHLDQDPEEHFNTLLMMIRASDDAGLVKPAYDAANKIDDDKKKAQALLDIVNEVNYLTRPQPADDSQS